MIHDYSPVGSWNRLYNVLFNLSIIQTVKGRKKNGP